MIWFFVACIVLYWYLEKKEYQRAKDDYFKQFSDKYEGEIEARRAKTKIEMSKYRTYTTEDYYNAE